MDILISTSSNKDGLHSYISVSLEKQQAAGRRVSGHSAVLPSGGRVPEFLRQSQYLHPQ